MSLFTAMNATATTANGDIAHHSSLDVCLDYFYAAGASRGRDLRCAFDLAYAANPDLAMRILQWSRDVRGGAGERKVFRDVIHHLLSKEGDFTNLANVLIPRIPEIGRWDDLLAFRNTPYESMAMGYWALAISNGDALAAKWAPRKNSKFLRKYLGMNERDWRKLVVKYTNVVETKMCAQDWDNINFNHVPSQAMSRYMTAFHRNSPAFAEWKAKLVKGDEDTKVNAGAIYPYTLISKLPKRGRSGDTFMRQDDSVVSAMWDALPDYVQGSKDRIMSIIDVSGSMDSQVPGQQSSILEVAASLGIYLAERISGPFKNQCISFSDNPRMYKLSGSLATKVNQITCSDNVGYSTDLAKCFDVLLSAAKKHKVSQEDMPTKFLIVSDMQFNNGSICGQNMSTFARIYAKYEAAGYTMPQIVFWQVNARATGTMPVTKHETGTALVSGYSPSLLTSILGGEISPQAIMLKAVFKERYAL